MEGKLNPWALWEERNRPQRPNMDEEMIDTAVRDMSIVWQDACAPANLLRIVTASGFKSPHISPNGAGTFCRNGV